MNLRVRIFGTISLIAGAMAASGCHSSTSPSDDLLRELARREAQWRAQGIHDYAFDYDVHAMVNTAPVRIDVRADKVVQVVVRATGDQLGTQGWPTMDSLFVQARLVIDRRQDHPTISYDAQRGFPTDIAAPSNVPDTGFELLVTNFAAGV